VDAQAILDGRPVSPPFERSESNGFSASGSRTVGLGVSFPHAPNSSDESRPAAPATPNFSMVLRERLDNRATSGSTGRKADDGDEEVVDGAHGRDELIEVDRFADVGVGVEVVRRDHVLLRF
jgi:hypothetical protein